MACRIDAEASISIVRQRNWYPGPRTDFPSFRSKFNPDLASYASHVDAQDSLRALQQSADALPNPILRTRVKSAVSCVSALWQTAKVKQNFGFLQSCMI